jgi:hypothetical protein
MAARNAGLDLLHGGKTSMTAKTRVRILYGAVTCGALIGSIVAYFNNFNTGRLGFAALGGAVAIVAANTMVALTHRRAPPRRSLGCVGPVSRRLSNFPQLSLDQKGGRRVARDGHQPLPIGDSATGSGWRTKCYRPHLRRHILDARNIPAST